MKLGIVTRYVGLNDGQGRVNYELAREALRQGHQVVMFAEAVDERIGTADGAGSVLAEPPRWLPTRLMRDQLFALRSRSQIHDKANRCDVLLSNGFATWADCDVNAIHFLHTTWLRSPYHPWHQRHDMRSFYARLYNGLNADLEKTALRRTRRVVAVSERIRQDLIAIGVPDERIVTITNGVDTAEFCPGPRERARFGLPEEPVIALFAGDLNSGRKNLDIVLRALRLVPDLHLAVAGRATGTPYPALAKALNVAERVHFLGFQRDMPALMRSVDLFTFPSRYDPFGLAMLEALACGLPVITTRTVGGSNLIDASCGIVLDDSEDHEACAAALADLAANPERRRAAGQGARAVAERHTWQAMAARYVDLLVEAAALRGQAGHA